MHSASVASSASSSEVLTVATSFAMATVAPRSHVTAAAVTSCFGEGSALSWL